MRMYFRYMKLAFRGQLQYRTSFLMTLAAQILVPFTVFAGMLLLFDRFHQLGEWTVDEVMLCFACTHIAFALSECFARGFDLFSGIVSQGEFDRVLVRPRNTVLQVLGARFEFTRIGKVLLFSVILGIALSRLSNDWNPLRILALVLMIVCGSLVFTAIFMMAATACFWTIQGIEFVNIFTDGGREMSQYPLDIYPKAFTRFFTFIIPFGLVNYLPLRWVLGRPDAQPWQAFLPLAALVFLVPAILLWRFGVHRYQSAGS